MSQTEISRLVLFILVYTLGTAFWIESPSDFVRQINISILIGLLFIIIMKLSKLLENIQGTKDEMDNTK